MVGYPDARPATPLDQMQIDAERHAADEPGDDRDLLWFRVSSPTRAGLVVAGWSWLGAFDAAVSLLECPAPTRIATEQLANGTILVRDVERSEVFIIAPEAGPDPEVYELLDEPTEELIFEAGSTGEAIDAEPRSLGTLREQVLALLRDPSRR